MSHVLAFLTPERVLIGCRALIGVHLLARAVIYGAGFFYWDDYVLEGRAATYPLLSPDFLMYLHNGHLMPGGMLLTGITERIGPLNYWVVLPVLIGLQGLATWLTYRLLRSLVGIRPALLFVVGLLCLTPMSLLPGAWWSAAINFLPLQVGVSLTGILLLRALRARDLRAQVVAVGVLVIALAFFEKALFIPLVAFAVTAASGPYYQGLLASVRQSLEKLRIYWFGVIPILGVYLIAYLGRAGGLTRELYDSTGIVILSVETLLRGLVPSFVGGPLSYEAAGFGTALADPSPAFVIAASSLAVAVVGYGVIQSRRSRAAWAFAAIWITGDVATLVLGRSGYDIILTLGTSLRYTVDSLVIVLVAIAVTLVPPYGTVDSPVASQLRAWLRKSTSRPSVMKVGAAVVIGFMAIAAVTSHVTLVGPLAANASRIWLMNIRKASLDQGTIIRVLDAPVPTSVYTPLGYPNNQLSHVLAPLGPQIQVVQAISKPVMFDEAGRLVAADVRGIDSFPGPDGDCGWAVQDEPVSIPIDGDLFPWQYKMRIRYLASENASMDVRLGDTAPVRVDLLRGPNEALLTIDGGGSRVIVGPFTGPGGVCVAQVTVGDLVPADQQN